MRAIFTAMLVAADVVHGPSSAYLYVVYKQNGHTPTTAKMKVTNLWIVVIHTLYVRVPVCVQHVHTNIQNT